MCKIIYDRVLEHFLPQPFFRLSAKTFHIILDIYLWMSKPMILNVFLYENHFETLLLKRMSVLHTLILHVAENFWEGLGWRGKYVVLKMFLGDSYKQSLIKRTEKDLEFLKRIFLIVNSSSSNNKWPYVFDNFIF